MFANNKAIIDQSSLTSSCKEDSTIKRSTTWVDSPTTPTLTRHANESSYCRKPKPPDVLLGRGSRSNSHPGNRRYLQRVCQTQDDYSKAPRDMKKAISSSVVAWVYESGGRFLELVDKEQDLWNEIDEKKARIKAAQALRDKHTPEAREERRKKYPKHKSRERTASKSAGSSSAPRANASAAAASSTRSRKAGLNSVTTKMKAEGPRAKAASSNATTPDAPAAGQGLVAPVFDLPPVFLVGPDQQDLNNAAAAASLHGSSVAAVDDDISYVTVDEQRLVDMYLGDGDEDEDDWLLGLQPPEDYFFSHASTA